MVYLTPAGHYCEGCLPDTWAASPKDVFTVYPDAQLDAYPVCTKCGRKHAYMGLSLQGARFEAEIVGPESGDIILTECGPANKMIELSILEDGVIGVYVPHQADRLRTDISNLRQSHPGANVWRIDGDGASELFDGTLDTGGEPEIYVNRKH